MKKEAEHLQYQPLQMLHATHHSSMFATQIREKIFKILWKSFVTIQRELNREKIVAFIVWFKKKKNCLFFPCTIAALVTAGVAKVKSRPWYCKESSTNAITSGLKLQQKHKIKNKIVLPPIPFVFFIFFLFFYSSVDLLLATICINHYHLLL